MDRPDILFVLLDQCAAKWIEVAESHDVCDLPHLRALREAGTSFTRCHASNPVCCPSRATIATGMSSRQHGLLKNGYELDPAVPTFMQALQDAGWRTAVSGKVHLHPHFAGVRPDYRGYGFDETHVTEDPRLGHWLDWVRLNHPEHYDDALMTVWTRQQPELDEPYDTTGKTLRQRLDELLEQRGPRLRMAYELPFPESICQTRWITNHALDIRRRTQAPLFMQIGYVQPHGPFTPPPGCLERVRSQNIPEPVAPAWPDDPAAPATFRETPLRDASEWRFIRSCYFADLCHLDDQLGEIVAAQREAGRLDQTYFFFLSDHGEMALDHGLKGKGHFHYDACTRVPLTVAGPGIARGEVREEFVQLEDVAPTVYELAGLEPPELPSRNAAFRARFGPVPAMHGRSLAPLLRGEPAPADWRSDAYCESFNNLGGVEPRQWSRTLIDADWRYTVYGDWGGEMLFHRAADPDERRNLAQDPDHAATLHAFRERLLHRVILQDAPAAPRGLYSMGVH